MIVTGAEPRADNLAEEPCWPLLSRLADWAEENAISTLWSCLAAHAAVYHLSGVSRTPLAKKKSGLFECTPLPNHPLTAGLPESWLSPHSRQNELPEAELLEKGFQPLIKIPEGLDTFMMERKSLFIFFQGHPEYDPKSLLLEYMRDVKRYVQGAREVYPEPPCGYFDPHTLQELEVLRQQGLQSRDEAIYVAVTRLLQGHQIKNVWRAPSILIYQNWLKYLAEEKSKRIARSATTN